jgi:hypothetical protein
MSTVPVPDNAACDFIATTVLFAVIAYVIENEPLPLTLGETEM